MQQVVGSFFWPATQLKAAGVLPTAFRRFWYSKSDFAVVAGSLFIYEDLLWVMFSSVPTMASH